MAWVCEVVGWARSREDDRGPRADDPALKAAMAAIALAWPTYGSRRGTAPWRRQGGTVNHQRVGRLIGEWGRQVPRNARVRQTTQSQPRFPRAPHLVPGLAIVRPAQVWGADITSSRLRNAFVSLAVLLEVLPSTIRGGQLGPALDQTWTRLAWPRALTQQTPAIHHSDQGVQ